MSTLILLGEKKRNNIFSKSILLLSKIYQH